MYPHRIRLRGPWEYEPVDQSTCTDGLPAPRRMTMPCRLRDVGLAAFAGRLRLRRRFGYPGRIDADERVWLTFGGLSDRAEIALNGQPLGAVVEEDCPWEIDITNLLQPRNQLTALLDAGNDGGGLWGEVALEIRRTAFLRDVQAQRAEDADTTCLRVIGEVVGSSERPLDLYALLGGKTAAYATVQPEAAGKRFELLAAASDVEGIARDPVARSLRLELVDGGVVWYTVETLIP